MARQTFRIEGLAELDAALAELPKATARNVLLRTLKEQGKPIRDAGEQNAPKLTGQMAISYVQSTKLSRSQKKKTTKESDVELYIGPAPSTKSIQTEFGNAHQAAEPHLRPAFDANVMKVLDGIRNALANQIEKTRARMAKNAERRAARLAAGK